MKIPECEEMIRFVKSEKSHAKSVVFLQEHYISFSASNQLLKDLERFCVYGTSTFVVDTTFQVCDGLWLTDSSFEYSALVNVDGKHPSFPNK